MMQNEFIRLELHSNALVGVKHRQIENNYDAKLVVVFEEFPISWLPPEVKVSEDGKFIRNSVDCKLALSKEQKGQLAGKKVLVQFREETARVNPFRVLEPNAPDFNCGFDLLVFATLQIDDSGETCIGTLKSGSIDIYATADSSTEDSSLLGSGLFGQPSTDIGGELNFLNSLWPDNGRRHVCGLYIGARKFDIEINESNERQRLIFQPPNEGQPASWMMSSPPCVGKHPGGNYLTPTGVRQRLLREIGPRVGSVEGIELGDSSSSDAGVRYYATEEGLVTELSLDHAVRIGSSELKWRPAYLLDGPNGFELNDTGYWAVEESNESSPLLTWAEPSWQIAMQELKFIASGVRGGKLYPAKESSGGLTQQQFLWARMTYPIARSAVASEGWTRFALPDRESDLDLDPVFELDQKDGWLFGLFEDDPLAPSLSLKITDTSVTLFSGNPRNLVVDSPIFDSYSKHLTDGASPPNVFIPSKVVVDCRLRFSVENSTNEDAEDRYSTELEYSPKGMFIQANSGAITAFLPYQYSPIVNYRSAGLPNLQLDNSGKLSRDTTHGLVQVEIGTLAWQESNLATVEYLENVKKIQGVLATAPWIETRESFRVSNDAQLKQHRRLFHRNLILEHNDFSVAAEDLLDDPTTDRLIPFSARHFVDSTRDHFCLAVEELGEAESELLNWLPGVSTETRPTIRFEYTPATVSAPVSVPVVESSSGQILSVGENESSLELMDWLTYDVRLNGVSVDQESKFSPELELKDADAEVEASDGFRRARYGNVPPLFDSAEYLEVWIPASTEEDNVVEWWAMLRSDGSLAAFDRLDETFSSIGKYNKDDSLAHVTCWNFEDQRVVLTISTSGKLAVYAKRLAGSEQPSTGWKLIAEHQAKLESLAISDAFRLDETTHCFLLDEEGSGIRVEYKEGVFSQAELRVDVRGPAGLKIFAYANGFFLAIVDESGKLNCFWQHDSGSEFSAIEIRKDIDDENHEDFDEIVSNIDIVLASKLELIAYCPSTNEICIFEFASKSKLQLQEIDRIKLPDPIVGMKVVKRPLERLGIPFGCKSYWICTANEGGEIDLWLSQDDKDQRLWSLDTDLADELDLFKRQPYFRIFAHSDSVIAMSGCQNAGASCLLTTGTDRYFRFWNLDSRQLHLEIENSAWCLDNLGSLRSKNIPPDGAKGFLSRVVSHLEDPSLNVADQTRGKANESVELSFVDPQNEQLLLKRNQDKDNHSEIRFSCEGLRLSFHDDQNFWRPDKQRHQLTYHGAFEFYSLAEGNKRLPIVGGVPISIFEIISIEGGLEENQLETNRICSLSVRAAFFNPLWFDQVDPNDTKTIEALTERAIQTGSTICMKLVQDQESESIAFKVDAGSVKASVLKPDGWEAGSIRWQMLGERHDAPTSEFYAGLQSIEFDVGFDEEAGRFQLNLSNDCRAQTLGGTQTIRSLNTVKLLSTGQDLHETSYEFGYESSWANLKSPQELKETFAISEDSISSDSILSGLFTSGEYNFLVSSNWIKKQITSWDSQLASRFGNVSFTETPTNNPKNFICRLPRHRWIELKRHYSVGNDFEVVGDRLEISRVAEDKNKTAPTFKDLSVAYPVSCIHSCAFGKQNLIVVGDEGGNLEIQHLERKEKISIDVFSAPIVHIASCEHDKETVLIASTSDEIAFVSATKKQLLFSWKISPDAANSEAHQITTMAASSKPEANLIVGTAKHLIHYRILNLSMPPESVEIYDVAFATSLAIFEDIVVATPQADDSQAVWLRLNETAVHSFDDDGSGDNAVEPGHYVVRGDATNHRRLYFVKPGSKVTIKEVLEDTSTEVPFQTVASPAFDIMPGTKEIQVGVTSEHIVVVPAYVDQNEERAIAKIYNLNSHVESERTVYSHRPNRKVIFDLAEFWLPQANLVLDAGLTSIDLQSGESWRCGFFDELEHLVFDFEEDRIALATQNENWIAVDTQTGLSPQPQPAGLDSISKDAACIARNGFGVVADDQNVWLGLLDGSQQVTQESPNQATLENPHGSIDFLACHRFEDSSAFVALHSQESEKNIVSVLQFEKGKACEFGEFNLPDGVVPLDILSIFDRAHLVLQSSSQEIQVWALDADGTNSLRWSFNSKAKIEAVQVSHCKEGPGLYVQTDNRIVFTSLTSLLKFDSSGTTISYVELDLRPSLPPQQQTGIDLRAWLKPNNSLLVTTSNDSVTWLPSVPGPVNSGIYSFLVGPHDRRGSAGFVNIWPEAAISDPDVTNGTSLALSHTETLRSTDEQVEVRFVGLDDDNSGIQARLNYVLLSSRQGKRTGREEALVIQNGLLTGILSFEAKKKLKHQVSSFEIVFVDQQLLFSKSDDSSRVAGHITLKFKDDSTLQGFVLCDLKVNQGKVEQVDLLQSPFVRYRRETVEKSLSGMLSLPVTSGVSNECSRLFRLDLTQVYSGEFSKNDFCVLRCSDGVSIFLEAVSPKQIALTSCLDIDVVRPAATAPLSTVRISHSDTLGDRIRFNILSSNSKPIVEPFPVSADSNREPIAPSSKDFSMIPLVNWDSTPKLIDTGFWLPKTRASGSNAESSDDEERIKELNTTNQLVKARSRNFFDSNDDSSVFLSRVEAGSTNTSIDLHNNRLSRFNVTLRTRFERDDQETGCTNPNTLHMNFGVDFRGVSRDSFTVPNRSVVASEPITVDDSSCANSPSIWRANNLGYRGRAPVVADSRNTDRKASRVTCIRRNTRKANKNQSGSIYIRNNTIFKDVSDSPFVPATITNSDSSLVPKDLKFRFAPTKPGSMQQFRVQVVSAASDLTTSLGPSEHFSMREPMQLNPPSGAGVWIRPEQGEDKNTLTVNWNERLGTIKTRVSGDKIKIRQTQEQGNVQVDALRLELTPISRKSIQLIVQIGDQVIDLTRDTPTFPIYSKTFESSLFPRLFIVSTDRDVLKTVACENVKILDRNDQPQEIAIEFRPHLILGSQGQVQKALPIEEKVDHIDEDDRAVFLYEIEAEELSTFDFDSVSEIGFGWKGTIKEPNSIDVDGMEAIYLVFDGLQGMKRIRRLSKSDVNAKISVGLATTETVSDQELKSVSQRMLFFGDSACPENGDGILLESGRWFAFDTQASETIEIESLREMQKQNHVFLVKYFVDGQTLFDHCSIP